MDRRRGRRVRGAWVGCLLGLLCGAAWASDIDARLDALFGAHEPYQRFLAQLKSATAAKRWPDVAALIAYPLVVPIAGKKVKIANSALFLAHPDRIFTDKVIAAVQSQTYGSLFANAQGVMIGDGEVWFSGVCRDAQCKDPPIKITAINP
jgi:hypothetical protein